MFLTLVSSVPRSNVTKYYNCAVIAVCSLDIKESHRYRKIHTRVSKIHRHMQDKQKVTLYLPPELHRQLKIRAAVESEPMSAIAERAIVFYLANPELVDEVEAAYGQTHRVYACPDCTGSVVLRDGELVSLKGQPSVIAEQELPVKQVPSKNAGGTSQPGEEELVPC